MNKVIYTTIFLIELILIINANELSKTSTELNNSETKNHKNDIPEGNESQKVKEMRINSNLHVTGNVVSSDITAGEAKISGNTEVANLIQAEKVISESLQTKLLSVETISSPTGVVTIQGDLILTNDISADSLNVRASSFIVQEIKQWSLREHDDFESEKSLEGWSDKRTNKCNKGKNTFLGGHCNFSYNEVYKIYKNLPAHKAIRVHASFHMFDSWDGETGYMKIDDEIVWTKQGQHSEKGINICGGDHNDPAFNIPIDVSFPHEKSEVKIAFGSTLDEDPCNESFGIDDVMIYTK